MAWYVLICISSWPGHPRRHLLTTGWSYFVSQKKLVAGDAVVFLRYVRTLDVDYLLRAGFQQVTDNAEDIIGFCFCEGVRTGS